MILHEFFDISFHELLLKGFFAEAVMRKRNELERMKMLRKDEERRREELVRLLLKIDKSKYFTKEHQRKTTKELTREMRR